MQHIHVFYQPVFAPSMEAVHGNNSGMVVDPAAMLLRLNQTNIKKILKLLIKNDCDNLENVRAFDDCLTAEAEAEGLLDESSERQPTQYGKKINSIMNWWDSELCKRDIYLRCGVC